MQTHSYDQNPAPLLMKFSTLLPRGRALDIAMGEGRNALYLASQGFQVEGLDNNSQAVSKCQELAQARQLSITAKVVNLEAYHLETQLYDLVICFYYLQRSLIPQIKGALKSGGAAVYETFLIDNHLQYGHPRHREYCFDHNELLGFFRDFRILFYNEGPLAEGQTFVAQIVAQKP
jgi:tellurite methyltransferase